MTELAGTAVALNTLQSREQFSMSAIKQNMDFQRQAVLELVNAAAATPALPAGVGQQVDQYA